jgi:hypothetical protein
MQDQPNAVVQTTVACDLERHSSCRSVVLTLTTAGTVNCACQCHNTVTVASLPDAWKEQAVLTPPCDGDVDLDHDELENLLDIEADRLLENEYLGVWS